MDSIVKIKLKNIVPDPLQPRQSFEPAELEKLQNSINSHGIMVPLAVEEIKGTSNYLLIDGERRFRASTNLGLKEVPVIIYGAMDSKERIMTRFHLQEQHSSWSVFDKAKAIAILKTESGLTDKEMAELLGLSITTIQDYMLMLSLSKRSVHYASENKLPFNYIKAIATLLNKVDDGDLRMKLEGSMLDRLKDKVVMKSSEIDNYKFAVVEGGEKMVKKLIDNPTMTAVQAIKAAGLEETLAIKKVAYQCSWIAGMLRKATARGYNKSITTTEEASINNLRDAAEEFLASSGAAVPGRK